MAALTGGARARARPPAAGEGRAIAALWRELWDAHEGWGGYPGSQDAAVYARLARRLDDEARVRAGRPILGGHLHLVADLGDEPCGQVEGWIDHAPAGLAPRGGGFLSSMTVCEVRSLIVAEGARRFGLGRVLLDALEKAVRARFHGGRCVLAAEVLEPNPAHAFYARAGFSPVAWSAYVDAGAAASIPVGPRRFVARPAVPGDAAAIAHLEGALAARRRAAGDPRFPWLPPLDAAVLVAIAARLSDEALAGDCGTIVVADRSGSVRGTASVEVQALEPPFEPLRRGMVGRFALDPEGPAPELFAALVALGARLAASRGAARVEITELTAPGTELYDAALAAGARPWSRVVTRQG